MSKTTWTTNPAQGMGGGYHHLQGLSKKEILIECTKEEAHLIAAAPDLLEALQSALDGSTNWQEAARVATAKATAS